MPDGGREPFLYQSLAGSIAYSRAARDVIAAMPDAVTQRRTIALDAMMGMLDMTGLLEKIDVFWDFIGAESIANACINLASPGDYTLTQVGSIQHAQGYGAKGDGSAGYFRTGWVPGTNGVQYQTSNCHLGAWEMANVANTSDTVAGAFGTGNLLLVTRTGPNQILAAGNTSTTTGTNGGTVTNSSGYTLMSRLGTTVDTYKDGNTSAVWSYTAGSATAVIGHDLYILARNSAGTPISFSARTLGLLHAGAALSAAEQATLYAIFADYIERIQGTNIYASAAAYNDIPLGVSTNIGSIVAPLLTVDSADTAAGTGKTIRLNGNPSSPSVYTHGSRLSLTGYGIRCANGARGAKLRATSTTLEVLLVSSAARIGDIIVDGQNTNPQCVELAAGSSGYLVRLAGTKLQDATLYGLWTSGAASYASVDLQDVDISLQNARGCVNWLGKTGQSLTVNGGTYTVANAILSGQGGIVAITTEPGVGAEIIDAEIDVTIDALFSGTTVYGIRFDNIALARVDGATISLDTTAAQKVAQGIVFQPTKDANVQDMGGFSVQNTTIEIRTYPGASAVGIWVGYDGTQDADVSNGMLDGGRIESVTVTGADAAAQLGGMHGIGIASHADTQVINCAVNRAGIHYVIKESAPVVDGCVSTGARSSHYLFKGSRNGAAVRNSRSVTNADGSGVHVEAHINDGTGNNCVGGVVENHEFLNDGGTSVRFVDVDANQDITFSGTNIYYNRSGTLNATPWRYHGISYATIEDWRAIDPGAVWADPDA